MPGTSKHGGETIAEFSRVISSSATDDATLYLRSHSIQLERDVQQYLCPIYGVSSSIGRPIGSGFLLQLSSATLLVTAAHVLREIHSCVLHTAGGGRIVPIEGWPHSTGPRAPSPNPDFGLDVGFIVLNEAAMQMRPSSRRLRPEDLDVDDIPTERTAYGFVGIPASANQATNHVFEGRSYFYGGLPAPEDVYSWLGYRLATHFVMKFERHLMINETSKIVAVPDPHGMSGGPVFRLGAFHEIEAASAQPKVIGVATEWWESRAVLVSLRISTVLDCLRQLLPEFASELPKPQRVEGKVMTHQDSE